ncbi:RES family NAD+ phosphorylase [Paraburkholderia sediminicola]|uniref:RES family NAD+ phosphorylase n=1 Tax=Paraburkholderia sediminicola TaxID=458836 RepID=UPI0038BB30C3
MKIVTSKLRARVVEASIDNWPRILPSRHRSTPANTGFGSSRFSSPSGAFRVLYAADNFPTAFAEAVVRDRFEGKTRRFLYRPHLEQMCVTSISSSRELALLDLRGAAPYEVGIDTDANRARTHASGQALSETVHADMNDIDGILFNSRLTTGDCVAIYDRAFAALSGTPPVALVQAALLPAELIRLGITVRRERGYVTP